MREGAGGLVAGTRDRSLSVDARGSFARGLKTIVDDTAEDDEKDCTAAI